MSGLDRLERDLAVWFEDTAVPKVPDYVDEIVQEAVRGRQRPRWTFVGRWLPASVARLGLPGTRVQWRPVVALILLALLLAVGLVLVGSRPRIPPPFGPAENGVVVFARDGDILTFDPESREERRLATGPDTELDPTWSLDGTRYVYLRGGTRGDQIVFEDREGGRQVLAQRLLLSIDPDSVSWSPDGRGVAARAGTHFYFVDADTGRVDDLPLDPSDLEVFWMPPDGRELVYRRIGPGEPGLVLHSLEDGTDRAIHPRYEGGQIRPRGWSPDGKRFVFHTTGPGDRPLKTYVFDLETNVTIPIDAAAGRMSNDGTRIAGFHYRDGIGSLCVADASGGPCAPVGTNTHETDVTHGDALNWSPDDEWLMVYPITGGEIILVDPNGQRADIVIPADGPGSWQRVAR